MKKNMLNVNLYKFFNIVLYFVLWTYISWVFKFCNPFSYFYFKRHFQTLKKVAMFGNLAMLHVYVIPNSEVLDHSDPISYNINNLFALHTLLEYTDQMSMLYRKRSHIIIDLTRKESRTGVQ